MRKAVSNVLLALGMSCFLAAGAKGTATYAQEDEYVVKCNFSNTGGCINKACKAPKSCKPNQDCSCLS